MKFKKLIILCIFSFCSAMIINQHEPHEQNFELEDPAKLSGHTSMEMEDTKDEVPKLELNLKSIISLL